MTGRFSRCSPTYLRGGRSPRPGFAPPAPPAPPLPGRLYDARDLALQRHLAEADPAELEAPDKPARPAADTAAISHAGGILAAGFPNRHALLPHGLRPSPKWHPD